MPEGATRDNDRYRCTKNHLDLASVMEGLGSATVKEAHRKYRDEVAPVHRRTVQRMMNTLEQLGLLSKNDAFEAVFTWVGWPQPIY